MVSYLLVSISAAASRGVIFYGSWWVWNVLVHGLENYYQHLVYGTGNFNCAVLVSQSAAEMIFRFVFLLYKVRFTMI